MCVPVALPSCCFSNLTAIQAKEKRFASGAWTGYYTLNGKRKDLQMDLQFTPYNKAVAGNGSDDFGFFSIAGEFSPTPPYNAKFMRSDFGQGGNSMEFTGFRESDQGGIFGTWKGTQGSGDFHIKPAAGDEGKLYCHPSLNSREHSSQQPPRKFKKPPRKSRASN